MSTDICTSSAHKRTVSLGPPAPDPQIKPNQLLSKARIALARSRGLSFFAHIPKPVPRCRGPPLLRSRFQKTEGTPYGRRENRIKVSGSLAGVTRACLKIVNTPRQRLFFRHASPIFLEIHQVFLRQIGFA